MNFRSGKFFSSIVLAISSSMPALAQTTIAHDVKPFAPASEFRTWSIGVGAGLVNQWNVMGFRRDFYSNESQLGYNFYIKKQLTSVLGFKAEYLGGKLTGSTDWNEDKFAAKLPWSAALSADLTLANISWRHEQGFIKPYLSLGLGALNYNTTRTKNGVEQELGSTTKAFIPASGGLKLGVTPRINVDLAYQVNIVNSGHLDGLATDRKDVFSYVHAGLEFLLGDVAKPFLGNRNPVADMRKEYLNLIDYDELAAALNAKKAEDETLNQQLVPDYVADDDGDGVANKFDKCSDTPIDVKVDGAGCPLPVAEHESGQDGTISEKDKQQIVMAAVKNLEFDSGLAVIQPTSYASLDQVAKLLMEDSNLRLVLAGHTDNTGTRQLNLRLSRERAEAVKTYLVSQGVDPSRIKAAGYGSARALNSNTTDEGRRTNRRVEFVLY